MRTFNCPFCQKSIDKAEEWSYYDKKLKEQIREVCEPCGRHMEKQQPKHKKRLKWKKETWAQYIERVNNG